jgi:hypothetical protein
MNTPRWLLWWVLFLSTHFDIMLYCEDVQVCNVMICVAGVERWKIATSHWGCSL